MKNKNNIDNNGDRQAVVQSWLDEKGLTRRSLSKWIGIDPSLMTYILSGKRNCTARVRSALESVGFPLETIPPAVFRRKANLKSEKTGVDQR